MRSGRRTSSAGQDLPALPPGLAGIIFSHRIRQPAINGLNRRRRPRGNASPAARMTRKTFFPAMWQPSESYPVFAYVLDANENLQVQLIATGAVSGEDPPSFAGIGASPAADGTCAWFNAGPAGGAYQTGHTYPGPSVALDSNGNLEFTRAGLTSGSVAPAWATAPGAATVDNGGAWINLGPPLPIVPIAANPLLPAPVGGPVTQPTGGVCGRHRHSG